MTPASSIQVANYVRGISAKPIDRGNLLHQISFSTSRLFSTAAEAFLYALDYDRVMPRAGTLVLETVAPDGELSIRHLLEYSDVMQGRCKGLAGNLQRSGDGGAAGVEITHD